MNDAQISALVTDLMIKKGAQVVAEAVARDSRADPHTVASVGYAMGFQMGLELGQLDPELARRTVTVLHAQQPEASDERNTNALTFIRLAREAT